MTQDTQTKHTPGPWVASTIHHPNFCFEILAHEDEMIAVIGNQDPQKEGGRCPITESGNARLIAAAPELLAALVIAEQELFRLLTPEAVEAAHAIQIARAAIARATGGKE